MEDNCVSSPLLRITYSILPALLIDGEVVVTIIAVVYEALFPSGCFSAANNRKPCSNWLKP